MNRWKNKYLLTTLLIILGISQTGCPTQVNLKRPLWTANQLSALNDLDPPKVFAKAQPWITRTTIMLKSEGLWLDQKQLCLLRLNQFQAPCQKNKSEPLLVSGLFNKLKALATSYRASQKERKKLALNLIASGDASYKLLEKVIYTAKQAGFQKLFLGACVKDKTSASCNLKLIPLSSPFIRARSIQNLGLYLTMLESQKGLTLQTRGSTIPQGCLFGKARKSKEPTFSPDPDRSYKKSSIQGCLLKIKNLFPQTKQLYLRPHRTMSYQSLLRLITATQYTSFGRSLLPQTILMHPFSLKSGSPKLHIISGQRNQQELKEVLKKHMQKIESCYKIAFSKGYVKAGRARMIVHVSSSGQVAHAQLMHTSIKSNLIQHCLKMFLKNIRFPPSTNGSASHFSIPVPIR